MEKNQHFLTLKTYVKSILEEAKVHKNAIFAISGALIFCFRQISALNAKMNEKANFRRSKGVKVADFALLESLELISRKTRVAGNF